MAAGATLWGRRTAEALMESTCTVVRAGAETQDTDTGAKIPGVDATVYSGKCRIRFGSNQPVSEDVADQKLSAQSPILSVPVEGSEGVRVDDVVTVTGNPLDSALVGATFRVAGIHAMTHATARRFPLEVLS